MNYRALGEVQGNAGGLGRLNPLIRCRWTIGHNAAPDKRTVLQVDPRQAGPDPVTSPMTA